jgi:hypothetical protein
LYGNTGFSIFTRDDCDAIFRALLRESGINRVRASTADAVLRVVAKSHWGDDSYHCSKLVQIYIQRVRIKQ